MYNRYCQLAEKILIRIATLLLLSWWSLVFVPNVLAVGNASFPQDTTLQITVAGTTRSFTITAGSDADSLTVNPSSFVFQISNGQNFKITSAQRFKFINDNNIATTCDPSTSNSSALNVLNPSTTKTITVTPDGSTCPTGGGGSAGGGSSVISNPSSPTITPTPSIIATPTVSATPTIIARVTTSPNPTPSTVNPSSVTGYLFKRSLKFGLSGDDVRALQDFLRSTGFYSPSVSTGFFDSPTKDSVIAWQKANGIEPARGIFGPLSISKYKKLTAVSKSNVIYSPAPIPKSKSLPAQVTPIGGLRYLNLRDKPSLSGRIIGKIYAGDILKVVDSRSYWYKVEKVSENLIGWVSKKYVTK